MESDPVDVTVPLVELARGLDTAFEDGEKREQFAAAVVVLARFVGQVLNREQGNKLLELGQALGDIGTGARISWLQSPKEMQHRDSSDMWIAKANLALAVEALIISGISPKDAEQEVISWHRTAWPRAERARLRQWRKDFSAGRVKNDTAQDWFKIGHDQIVATDKKQLGRLAKAAAAQAAKVDGVFS